ncbi:hypothetical protein J7J90_00460 [Candidatus Micrarchaeota archaeon]|nr:hypothetical protein [Candidatus Micrarchaeota archaeon]
MRAVKKVLLRKLAKHGYWGKKHTSFDNLPKGFPKHLHSKVKEVAKKLIKENIILSKPTNYGLEVSLNPKMKDRIEKILFEHKMKQE